MRMDKYSRLEDFYEQIIMHRILPSSDRRESCMIVQLVATMKAWDINIGARPELGVWFFSRMTGILNNEVDSMKPDSEDEIQQRVDDFKNRSYGLFRGLLEIGPRKNWVFKIPGSGASVTYLQHQLLSPPLRFIHRSAFDFVQSGKIKSLLQQVSPEADMITTLLKCLLACTRNMKTLPRWHYEATYEWHSLLRQMITWLNGLERYEQYHTLLEDLDTAVLQNELGTLDGNIDWSRFKGFNKLRSHSSGWTSSVFAYSYLLGLDILVHRLGASDHWTGRTELQTALLKAAVWDLPYDSVIRDLAGLPKHSRGLSLMLSNGFDPNHQLKSSRQSPWLIYIVRIMHDRAIFQPGHSHWYFVEKFLRYGAEPRVWFQWEVDEECDDIRHEDMMAYLREVRVKSFIQIGGDRKKTIFKFEGSSYRISLSPKNVNANFISLFPTGAHLRDLAQYVGRQDIAELIDGKIRGLGEINRGKYQGGEEEGDSEFNWTEDEDKENAERESKVVEADQDYEEEKEERDNEKEREEEEEIASNTKVSS